MVNKDEYITAVFIRLDDDCFAVTRVIEKLSTDNVGVRGVTSVDDKLFVLLLRDVKQVAVYSVDNYQLLHHLSLPGLNPDGRNDLTSCVRHKCIYMSDGHNRRILRYDSAAGVTSQWEIPNAAPKGLSVTPSCNLLVTCHLPNKLVELSADSGQCVREIALQSDIVQPWQGIQLTTGQYVVCHGNWESLHRVCLVDGDGKVTRDYGGQCGFDVDHLKMPSHLAVDKESRFIFVADCLNDRVMLLSPTFEFVRYTRQGSSRPYRLHIDNATRRLYVGQSYGDVTVIQL